MGHDYGSMVQWSASGVFTDCITWLSTLDSPAVSYSRAWLFSASRTEQLLCTLVPKELCETLRVLAKASMLIHHYERASFSFPRQLHGLRCFAGNHMIQALEGALRPTSLANSSINDLGGLFLLLLGTTIAVSYTNGSVASPEVGFPSAIHTLHH